MSSPFFVFFYFIITVSLDRPLRNIVLMLKGRPCLCVQNKNYSFYNRFIHSDSTPIRQWELLQDCYGKTLYFQCALNFVSLFFSGLVDFDSKTVDDLFQGVLSNPQAQQSEANQPNSMSSYTIFKNHLCIVGLWFVFTVLSVLPTPTWVFWMNGA